MENSQKAIPGINQNLDFDKIYNIDIRYNGYFGISGFTQRLNINQAKAEMRQKVLEKFYIPEKYSNASFENYILKDNAEAYGKIKSIASNGFVSEKKKTNISIILWSKNIYGVGKTHLLYAMFKAYLNSDKLFCITPKSDTEIQISFKALKFIILPEYELLNKIKDTFKSDSSRSEKDIFTELNRFDILCIDDMVKYNPTNLDFYQRVMFQIIDERYNRMKAIIITTNKHPKELAEFIGIAAADRLYEMTKGYQIEFKGQSYRDRREI